MLYILCAESQFLQACEFFCNFHADGNVAMHMFCYVFYYKTHAKHAVDYICSKLEKKSFPSGMSWQQIH